MRFRLNSHVLPGACAICTGITSFNDLFGLVAMELGDASALGEATAFAGVFSAGTIEFPGVFTDGPAVIQDIAGTSYGNEWVVVFYA